MAVTITIARPDGKGEPIVMADEEMVTLRVNLLHTSSKKDAVQREVLVYFHGEEAPNGDCNGMINTVVKA